MNQSKLNENIMKISVIIRRLITLIIPKSTVRKLKLSAPDRGGIEKFIRENELLDVAGFPANAKLKVLDFGCGRMRIGRTGRVKAYYVDTASSAYIERDCDSRGLNALASLENAGIKFDAILANSSIQYLFPEDVFEFFRLSSGLLCSERESFLFLEIDQRDLLDGVDKRTGVAYYKNDFKNIIDICNNSGSSTRELYSRIMKILQKANIYTNSLRFDDYFKRFENYFVLLRAQQNLDGLASSWTDCEVVDKDALLFRLWLRNR